MSKAFTRDDDGNEQADLLPELAVSPYPNLVTSLGLAGIEAEIVRLKKIHAKAMESGDDAAAAIAARDLHYWFSRRDTAQLVENSTGPQVMFGSRVTLARDDGITATYRIVGTDEADPKQGTLSYVAPLAQALMGKTVGDTVTVAAHEFTIVTFA